MNLAKKVSSHKFKKPTVKEEIIAKAKNFKILKTKPSISHDNPYPTSKGSRVVSILGCFELNTGECEQCCGSGSGIR